MPEELPSSALQAQTTLGPNKEGHGDRHFSEKAKGLSIGFRATAGVIQGKKMDRSEHVNGEVFI